MESSVVVSVIPPAQAHMAHALTQPLKPSSNHPPYAEMIVSAIKALKERKGSSKKAIAKYIDSTYVNLPQSHSALLTHHLKRLKKNGMVLMVKHSYKLPTSGVADGGVKRGRGRPPKPIGPDATVVVGGPEKKGRGRPPTKVAKPKVTGPGGVVKRGRGRPPKPIVGPVGVDGEKRGRGRPKKNAADNTVPLITVSTTPVVTEEVVVSRGRPRGRPAKASGGPPKTKSVSTGRPVGRPRKSSGPIIVPSPVPVVE